MRTLIRCLALLPPAIHPERASVDVLVISPTRELATQIAKQASALATFDNGKIGCVGEWVLGDVMTSVNIYMHECVVLLLKGRSCLIHEERKFGCWSHVHARSFSSFLLYLQRFPSLILKLIAIHVPPSSLTHTTYPSAFSFPQCAAGCAVQVCYGGTNANTDKSRFSRDPPSVLVSTPGAAMSYSIPYLPLWMKRLCRAYAFMLNCDGDSIISCFCSWYSSFIANVIFFLCMHWLLEAFRRHHRTNISSPDPCAFSVLPPSFIS